jgi:L-threonylcarbamoyladenylate synthase
LREIQEKYGSLQNMNTIIGTNVSLAAQLLREGKLVAIPTETVYGLAGNALNPDTVIRIFEAKNRPAFNPLILHVPSVEAAQLYVQNIPDSIRLLMERFSPGPISYLLPKRDIVPDMVTSGSDRVVIRIPNHPVTLELLQKLDFPLAAPSANPFGYVSPVTAADVYQGLSGKVDYILDGGSCIVGLESTIVGEEEGALVVYRLGGITLEQMEAVTGCLPRLALLHKRPDTPGQLKSHYAPGKRVLLGDIDQQLEGMNPLRAGVISFSREYKEVGKLCVLSPSGDLREAAAGLFRALRDMDAADVDVILAERFPDEGIGRAINDRLMRASAKL